MGLESRNGSPSGQVMPKATLLHCLTRPPSREGFFSPFGIAEACRRISLRHPKWPHASPRFLAFGWHPFEASSRQEAHPKAWHLSSIGRTAAKSSACRRQNRADARDCQPDLAISAIASILQLQHEKRRDTRAREVSLRVPPGRWSDCRMTSGRFGQMGGA